MNHVTINLNINIDTRTDRAKFWCKECGRHFYAEAYHVVDDRARCPYCNSNRISPHVSELLPITVSNLEDEPSDLQKQSALLRIIVGR